METIATLLPYRVTLKEDAGDKFTVAFDCQAEVTDHAEEQAENAYPGCEIVNITQMEPRPWAWFKCHWPLSQSAVQMNLTKRMVTSRACT